MPEAWRIVKAPHVATAFTGEGAAKFGGRWNSRGVAVVYTSATQSLATLETLVHLTPPVNFRYQIARLEFNDRLVEILHVNALPSDWRVQPAPPSTRQLGDEWARSLRTPVLGVPSAIIPHEINYLLNPAHPDFQKIIFHRFIDFTFDPRLLPPTGVAVPVQPAKLQAPKRKKRRSSKT